jgi:hypothetical protein
MEAAAPGAALRSGSRQPSGRQYSPEGSPATSRSQLWHHQPPAACRRYGQDFVLGQRLDDPAKKITASKDCGDTHGASLDPDIAMAPKDDCARRPTNSSSGHGAPEKPPVSIASSDRRIGSELKGRWCWS